ncbi:MAG TPA: barstar family protein [Hyphomonadaceae bacterium]|nr:barstar family protein [Hyphomonadaceae bacterium]
MSYVQFSRKEFAIDGTKVSSIATFAEEFSRSVLGTYKWNGNLDAFNDILRGGFGTPDDGFLIKWQNSAVSRERLGYAQTVRELQDRLTTCHPSNRNGVQREISRAQRKEGPTAFDWLVEIIQDHGPGGSQEEDGVVLRLE